MRELELIRSRIRQNPEGDAEQTFHQVIVALETNGAVDVARLYALDYDSFKLVLGLVDSWWLQRYTGIARNGVAAEATLFLDQRDSAVPAED